MSRDSTAAAVAFTMERLSQRRRPAHAFRPDRDDADSGEEDSPVRRRAIRYRSEQVRVDIIGAQGRYIRMAWLCTVPLGLGSITGELRARDTSFALSNFPQNLENGDQYAEYCVVKMCQK